MNKKNTRKKKEDKNYEAGKRKILIEREMYEDINISDFAKRDANAIIEKFNKELEKVSLI